MDESILFLNDEQTEGLVDMQEAIDAIEIAFRELGQGISQNIPRYRIQFPKKPQQNDYCLFNNMAGFVSAFDSIALRFNLATRKVFHSDGKERSRLENNSLGLVLLFDTETNRLLAILQDRNLSPMRVAATSALGAKILSRNDAAMMGILGTGLQARAHAEAICQVRKIRKIKVFSPDETHRELFAKEMANRLNTEVLPVGNAQQAVSGADIVAAATSSNEPVFRGEWLEPGTHVVTITFSDRFMHSRETDESTARRADIVVLNSKEQAHLDSQPEFAELVARGVLKWESMYELADVVLGKSPRRNGAQQITVHYNNTGMGIQFAAIGALIYRKAIEQGVGAHIPASLFVS